VTDHLVRAIAKEAGVRALACVTTDVARDAARRHGAEPVAAAALGYGLTAAALLGGLLKVQQRVALKVQGDGPLGKLVAEADAYGRVRGYVAAPTVAWPPPIDGAAVGAALGQQGLLTVVKDVGMKDLTEGTVALGAGRLDQELMVYLTRSEQVLSYVDLDVKLDDRGRLLAAGGLLLQALPDYDPARLTALVQATDDLPPLADMLVAGQEPAAMLSALFGALPYEVLDVTALTFHCTCSRERSLRALQLLERSDLELLIAEGEGVVDCHFCHERYVFGVADLHALLAELDTEKRA
jgi:molecular chaperone Hsp33